MATPNYFTADDESDSDNLYIALQHLWGRPAHKHYLEASGADFLSPIVADVMSWAVYIEYYTKIRKYDDAYSNVPFELTDDDPMLRIPAVSYWGYPSDDLVWSVMVFKHRTIAKLFLLGQLVKGGIR